MTITFTALTAGTSDGGLLLALSAHGYGGVQPESRGRADIALRIAGTSYSTASVEVPTIPAHGVASLAIAAAGQSFSGIAAYGQLDLGISLLGYDGSATGGGRVTLGLSMQGYAQPAAGAYGFAVAQGSVVSSYGGLWIENLREPVQFSGQFDALQTAVLRSALAAAGGTGGRLEASEASEDELVFGQSLAVVWQMLVDEGLVLSGTAEGDAQKIASVVSRLVLSGEVSTYAEAVVAVTAGLVFGALVDVLALEQITDQVQLSALVNALFTATEQMLESLVASAAVTGTGVATVLVDEGLALADTPATVAELMAQLTESVGLFMTLALDDGNYVAWVLNTESRGLSRYTNYPFNSFMRVAGRYYGVASTGLYLLEGDDDDGTPIAAKIRLGMSDLGTRRLKRVPEGFIGYTSTGTLLLQVITADEATGEKTGAYYTLAPRGAAGVRENRWKIGRGLKSVDWDFEITNVDGADFDLYSIEWHPLVLDRRTRG